MTKEELSQILHNTGCPVNEGVTDLKNTTTCPRIDYWEIVWENIMGSGGDYELKVTYQVSFYARKPREKALIDLKKALNEEGVYPVIYHEFNIEDRIWHSYFSVEVTGEEL